MNPELDKQLEAETDRRLKALPDLAAPPSLIARTMNAISRPAAPWHARPWSAWPAGLRAAFLVVTIGALGGAIPVLHELGPRLFGPLAGQFAHWRVGVECIWNAAGALTGAVTVVLSHLGKGFVLPCVLLVVLAYAACVGFGTLLVRLALSGSRKN